MPQPPVLEQYVVMIPAVQDALRDPEKWNNQWEALHTKDLLPPLTVFWAVVQEYTVNKRSYDIALDEYPHLIVNLCGLERWLTIDAACYLTSDDLEKRWLSATRADRRKHVMFGLSHACAIARNLNDARKFTGRELRVEELSRDGNRLLDLLKVVMLDDASSVPTTPTYFPDPDWDKLQRDILQDSNTNQIEKICLSEILGIRTKLICHVIHFTLRSFLGLDPPKITVVKAGKPQPAENTSLDQLQNQALKAMLSPGERKAYKQDHISSWKDRYDSRVGQCEGCLKTEPADKKFSRCGKCWGNLKRVVKYCSPECQKKDWKARHKIVCGRALDFDTAQKAANTPRAGSVLEEPPSETGRIGPTVGGFKRTPALVVQVSALNQTQSIDYLIHFPTFDGPIDFNDPVVRALFRRLRNRAMTTGDKECVAVLCHFLCWMLTAERRDLSMLNGLNPAKIVVEQMKKEFAFEELGTAVLEMQKRAWADPLRKPPMVKDLGDAHWIGFCMSMDMSKKIVLD